MWENSTYKIYVRVESWSQKSSKYATCKGYVSIFFILDSMHFTQYELSEVITLLLFQRGKLNFVTFYQELVKASFERFQLKQF